MQNPLQYGFMVLCLGLAGCAASADPQDAAAPQPAKPIDATRFYTGTWYEIARTPMSIICAGE
jgi:lipocalin